MAVSTWIADGAHGNLASTAENWDTLPGSGSDIVFNNTSVVNCTFDLAIASGSFTIAATPGAGYTGTVTQAASFSVTSYSQAAGTFTGSTSYWLTCNGNFTRSAGFVTGWKLKLIMAGANGIISTGSSFNIMGLSIQDDISIAASTPIIIPGTANCPLIIASGKTLTLSSSLQRNWYSGSLATDYDNDGIIAGTSSLIILLYDADKSITFGVVSCPVNIQLHAISTTSYILSLEQNTTFGSTLNIYSLHASHTTTLSHGLNYQLSVAGTVILGNRGIMNQGMGNWSFGAFTQSGTDSIFNQNGPLKVSGAGGISDGSWNVNAVARVASLSQSGGTITVAAGMILYYDSTASLTGGTRSGVIDRWPFSSEKGDDAVPFETPKAGARF